MVKCPKVQKVMSNFHNSVSNFCKDLFSVVLVQNLLRRPQRQNIMSPLVIKKKLNFRVFLELDVQLTIECALSVLQFLNVYLEKLCLEIIY